MSIETAFADKAFVLATDLDGTFLGGSEADRRSLYRWIEASRGTVGLIFVTGRDPAFIGELCSSGEAPWPDYVVGDVGTTVAAVVPNAADPIRPIAALEAEIAALWADSGARVREALAGAPGLAAQDTAFRHRLSYDMDPDRFRAEEAAAAIAALGLDSLVSDNRYFDVLPPGVSKGPTLRRLLDHLNVDPTRVLAAGDTMNDLSMLESGLNAVAVGGAETELLERVGALRSVYKAKGVGAAGIAEAIAHFDLHATPKADTHAL